MMKTIKVFLTHTHKLDKLKTQLNIYYVHLSENQRTSHVFVHVSCVNLVWFLALNVVLLLYQNSKWVNSRWLFQTWLNSRWGSV